MWSISYAKVEQTRKCVTEKALFRAVSLLGKLLPGIAEYRDDSPPQFTNENFLLRGSNKGELEPTCVRD